MTDEQEARITDALNAAADRITAKIIAALAGTSRPTGGQSSAPATTGGACFPNYGKAKNAPVFGAALGDLNYYADNCRRTLDNPEKSRWHDKERVLLAAIEAEIDRQNGVSRGGLVSPSSGGGIDFANLPGDDEIPF